tara:strand:+ start:121 stop:624 length:504 start_codon:yes stop_codon:yes gene_type:complete
MKITKQRLKEIIKEELQTVLAEGDMPRYNDLEDERKDLARAAVQNYFNNVEDYELDDNYSRSIEQIVWDALQNAHPNRRIGDDIRNMLVQKYPKEVEVLGKSPKFPGVKQHPHWTPLSWGVREELGSLKDAIKSIPDSPERDREILDRLRGDWAGYARELGVALGQG